MEPARAEVVRHDALSELASIPSAKWRAFTWRSLIEIHRAAGSWTAWLLTATAP